MFSLILVLLYTINPIITEPPVWLTNVDEALEEAYHSERFVLMLFTGSDWCIPCRQLKKKVFEQEIFWNYAHNRLVLVEVDFPRMKENRLPRWQQRYNTELALEFNPDNVFPLMILLEKQDTATVINTLFFQNESAEVFIKKIEGTLPR